MNTFFSNMVVALAALASVTAIAPIELGTAENYAILTQTGISTVPASDITGHIAVSPIDDTAMTGFSFTKDSDGTKATSTQVSGEAYAANFSPPIPASLTIAVGDMQTAFTDAASRDNANAARIDLGGGILGEPVDKAGDAASPLSPGVYTFGTDVLIVKDIVFHGGADDIFIIQVTGNVVMDANKIVTLTGGALAKNIFWQVAGFVTVSAGAHMEGIILCKTKVDFLTGSSLNGRILSQTAANLQSAIITQPV